MAGDEGSLAARERGSAGAFARECRRAGVGRLVYLGGLGDAGASEHLGSRQGSADALRAEGPPLVYFRAGMVVGAGSESYVLLRSLIEKLPGNVILAPSWIHNRTQPIALEDVVHYLVQAATLEEAAGREFQIGGPDVMTYAEMLDEMSKALGGEPLRRVGADSLSAKAAGRGAAAVTEGNPRIAELITAGLETDTVVEDDAALERLRRRARPAADRAREGDRAGRPGPRGRVQRRAPLMPGVTSEIELAAAPDAVWDVVMDPHRLGDWVTTHVAVSATTRRPS